MNVSENLWNRAKQVIPGGVNSPVRAFKSVGLDPVFVKSAKGADITDVDGNKYIDYVGSWGPMILGHAHNEVVQAVTKAAVNSTSFGAPCEYEVLLAELICESIPSIEMIRMVSSGTEAVMSAIRTARGFTGRNCILKFEGCYHGHADGMLVKAGSGAMTTGVPNSLGVPEGYAKYTITAPFNDCDKLEQIFDNYGKDLATVIVEPVPANMGVIIPEIEFLKTLRRLTEKHGIILIFDEVITGFRLGFGGAQEYYGICPDLTVYGKIIGGGMPVGAYGGRKDVMSTVSPLGGVYQAGTLSGNPCAMAAGLTTLNICRNNPHMYIELEEKAKILKSAFEGAAQKYGIPLTVNMCGSLLTPFFTAVNPVNYDTASMSDTGMFAEYFKLMLEKKIYTAPSQFEAMFISAAHTDEDIKTTVRAIEQIIPEIKL